MTYRAEQVGFAGDPFRHRWEATEARRMFDESEIDPSLPQKRWATRLGIAFVAQESNDGTWHGYPESWQKAPADLVEKWFSQGKVTAADLRRYKDFPRNDVRWALESDDE